MHNEFVLVACVLHLVLYSPVHQTSIDVSSCGQQVAVKQDQTTRLKNLHWWYGWRHEIWSHMRYAEDYGMHIDTVWMCMDSGKNWQISVVKRLVCFPPLEHVGIESIQQNL